jgi:hypothetical protein
MIKSFATDLMALVGSKLFYLGFRMQPVGVRRMISLLLSVGLQWTKGHDDIVQRVARGEHVGDLAIDFTTREVEPE